ncbi:MAG: aminoacyl-tRNA hydrolase [Candidatus Zambryskibacteria bacterium CG10_big_fil_rev_8_21_14_0_10_42_12]|uniref:Peptidyl-tRNA hydrolase n=1 Tax=Candidatus Zambryskibacteria bacterium CG10_big_fil_rev_8_21_14_0_10_42_12 TaxID=1975115 RepID=A0A2H0QVB5_9BACT|nr:MAG: aminoacyl-tRNA hydrolase [Candidatus Zambryskibacteria bacterium CG10_big_fil_rev_8_21_14_0_10_42_12]
MKVMVTVVGLGNPGKEYEQTRHNVGRMIVEDVALYFGVREWKEDKKKVALVASGGTGKEKIEYILPETFMNKSGKSLAHLKGGVKKIENTIVIHDDLDMPVGSAKMLFNRGDGGHKGVISINKSIGSKAYVRIKIGISKTTPAGNIKKPKGEEAVQKHVLGEFSLDELKIIKKISKGVAEALELFMGDGRAKAQTIFNSRY